MRDYFKAKIRYVKTLDSGKLKRVTEEYLFDAVSFSDAEEKVYKHLGEFIRGEFTIVDISRNNFQEIFPYDETEDWHKARVSYIDIDTESGREKKTTVEMLVNAESPKQGFERVTESLADMMVPFEITNVGVTKILEYYPYESENTKEEEVLETASEH